MRFIMLAIALVVVCGPCAAAPVPPRAKELVAGLSDPSPKVRDEAAATLKGRPDALPWLRRAARSADKGTAKRAADLLAPAEKKRQEVVAKVIDACIRDGRIDLFMEWHHYWRPENTDDLWPVGPRAAKAGMDLYAKSCLPEMTKKFEESLLPTEKKNGFYDGPRAEMKLAPRGNVYLRTDRWERGFGKCQFATITGPFDPVLGAGADSSRCFVLGAAPMGTISRAFVACDGEVGSTFSTAVSFVVCRGNFHGGGRGVASSVLLVDGDIDLTQAQTIRDSLIRASGEIRLPKDKDAQPLNCTIEAGAKNATVPYQFFELTDVGLSVADDEEGLVVAAAKPDTPFGTCGLQKGDLIRALDDAPYGRSEPFRKAVRRALVRQGDCLLTVVRGDKTLDLPVFFPLPQ